MAFQSNALYRVDDFDAKWMMSVSSQVSSNGRIEDLDARWIWNSHHVTIIHPIEISNCGPLDPMLLPCG